MQKRINNIKSIIINGNKYNVDCINNKNSGIKFYYKETLYKIFKYDFINSITYPIENNGNPIPVKIITNNGKIWTLFNCLYTVTRLEKNNNECYVHLIYNEIIKKEVDRRDFSCNKLEVTLDRIFDYTYDCIPKSFEFNINKDITISYENDKITIQSEKIRNRHVYYEYFISLFELFFLIYGFFFTCKKFIYYKNKDKICVENNLPSKYISDKICIKKDNLFINKLSSNEIKKIYNNYIEFQKKSELQLNLFFITLMEKYGSYNEIRVVNLLQILDGLYYELKRFKTKTEEFPKKEMKLISEKISEVNFPDIKNVSGEKIDINRRINNITEKMYLYSFRKRLKEMFKINDAIVFKKEINKEPNHINLKSLIDKCYNSRNRLSHVTNDKENFLKNNENVVYMHKLILTIRLLIFQDISLNSYINNEKLSKLINNIDRYIEKNLYK